MDPIIKNIIDAFTRIRAILFVNLTICALIFSNTYLEIFSFDQKLILLSDIFKTSLQKSLKKAQNKLQKADESDKRKLAESISAYKARIERIDNTLSEFKLQSVQVPVVGINVPSNDLAVIGGIFLLSISVWLVFSINQIKTSFSDQEMNKILEKNIVLLRSSMMFVLPKGKRMLRFLGFMIVAAPALAMTSATLNDLWTILSYDQKSALYFMLGTILARLMLLSAISVALWLIAIMVLQGWGVLNSRLHKET